MTEDSCFNFTKTAIADLPLPAAGKRKWYRDSKARYLALMVTARGSKNFYHYRWVQGRPQQTLIGAFPDLTVEQARKKAEEMNGLVAQGENPRAVSGRARGEMTFGELGAWYIEDAKARERKSVPQYESYLRSHLGGLSKIKVSHVRRQDLDKLHQEIKKKAGHVAANKAMRLVHAIYNRAIAGHQFKGPNPAHGMEYFTETSRERRLTTSEFPRFFDAVAQEPNADVRDFVLLSLYTGARKSNVLAMAWDQIDWDGGVWRIPTTKNGTPQTVPLEDDELDVLRRRRSEVAGPWVFPGSGASGHMRDPRKGWMRILERAGLQDLHIHDLRRTLGSCMVDENVSLPIIGKALHHQSPDSTRIYARLQLDPVRKAKKKAHAAIRSAAGARGGGI